jgi:4-diphosphocytidyl-2-C-methyl-D-erythritol kinase
LAALAPAKVNLTLRILGRRSDGYHDLESLVVFAPFGDRLALRLGPQLSLTVSGPRAADAGPLADNLVLRAASALGARLDGLRLGRFALTKRLPAGAGLGGGSADAAAALRLIAQANGLGLDEPPIREVARATGADVPVCLDPRPRLMCGIGDVLSAPLALPALGIVIVHPGVAVPTAEVFKALGLAPGERRAASSSAVGAPWSAGVPHAGYLPAAAQDDRICPGAPAPSPRLPLGRSRPSSTGYGEGWGKGAFPQAQTRGSASSPDLSAQAGRGEGKDRQRQEREALLAWLAAQSNDLEVAAIAIAPAIADVLSALAELPGCRLVRMSGSGSACFGLFATARAATAAARRLALARPEWWVRAGSLGK